MTNMNPAEFLNVVDHAAGQDDRWLSLAAFCLLLALCAVVIYWLVRHLQAMIVEHKALQAELSGHGLPGKNAGDPPGRRRCRSGVLGPGSLGQGTRPTRSRMPL
jgi:hypothetical protein